MTTHPKSYEDFNMEFLSLRTAACGHPPTDALLAAGAPGRLNTLLQWLLRPLMP